MECPKCGGKVKSKKQWGIITYTCIECNHRWHEEKKKKCPKCGSKEVGFREIRGDLYKICFDCNHKVKMEEEKQYYYERDAVENEVGLIEEMRDHL